MRGGNQRLPISGWIVAILCALMAAMVLQVFQEAVSAQENPTGTVATEEKADAPVTESETPTGLMLILAPFLALALAIERFWEAIFDTLEKIALATGKLIGTVAAETKWVRTELENAGKVVKDLAAELGDKDPRDPTYDKALANLGEAEQRLLDAESRSAELIKAPGYLALKRAITLIGSLVIGVAIAVSTQLRLFDAAGFQIGRWPDIVFTGLLVGSGPGPLHSFIGALQETRNAIAGVADLARGTAIKNARNALASEVQVTRKAGANEAAGVNESMNLSAESAEKITAGDGEVTVNISPLTAQQELRRQRQAARLIRPPGR